MKTCRDMLREFRVSKGITQTHVAKMTGKDPKRISALETGEIALKGDELLDIIINGFGVSPAYFFTIELSENERTAPTTPS